MIELDRHKFAYIPVAKQEYFEQEALFGENVKNAFKDAANDIKNAGNCYAANLYTAIIFHLMRIAEYGLRALARERGVTLKNKPLEWGEWGIIIRDIEKKVDPMESAHAGPEKDAALSFYRGIIGKLRAFKIVYRHPTMHPRYDYDEYEAWKAM